MRYFLAGVLIAALVAALVYFWVDPVCEHGVFYFKGVVQCHPGFYWLDTA